MRRLRTQGEARVKHVTTMDMASLNLLSKMLYSTWENSQGASPMFSEKMRKGVVEIRLVKCLLTNCLARSISNTAETRVGALSLGWREVDFMRWFSVAFLTNCVFIVTRVRRIRTHNPCTMSPHAEPLHLGQCCFSLSLIIHGRLRIIA